MDNNIIDIHVHIFPDYMSVKAVERLESKYKLSFIAKPVLKDLFGLWIQAVSVSL